MLILFKLFRINQWIKNLLIFAPLIFDRNYNYQSYFNLIDVFFAFSIICSATYIFNDLIDLNNDKKHPTKKLRPLASGKFKIKNAKLTIFFLISASFSYIYFFDKTELIKFFLLYLIFNLFYTLYFKKKYLLDIILLVSFYIIRIIIGSESSEITVSYWLIICSIFFFTSLAFLKRANDLNKYYKISKFNRAYSLKDLNLMIKSFLFFGISTIVVFNLYINFSEATQLLENKNKLYLIPILLTIFYFLLYKQFNNKEIDDDPTTHIIYNKMILILLISIFVTFLIV